MFWQLTCLFPSDPCTSSPFLVAGWSQSNEIVDMEILSVSCEVLSISTCQRDYHCHYCFHVFTAFCSLTTHARDSLLQRQRFSLWRNYCLLELKKIWFTDGPCLGQKADFACPAICVLTEGSSWVRHRRWRRGLWREKIQGVCIVGWRCIVWLSTHWKAVFTKTDIRSYK